MAYRLTYEYRQRYLFILMEGEESNESAIQFWQDLSLKSQAESINYFMITDKVSGQLSTVEHYYISKLVANHFAGKVIAYIDPKQETYENNRFGETVVNNRGVTAKVFQTEGEAEIWLVQRISR